MDVFQFFFTRVNIYGATTISGRVQAIRGARIGGFLYIYGVRVVRVHVRRFSLW